MRLSKSLITAISLVVLLYASTGYPDDVSRGRQLWNDPDGDPAGVPFSQIDTPSGGMADDGDGTGTLDWTVLTAAVPSLRFTDSSTGEDDYEFYADGDSFYLTNVTSGAQVYRYQGNELQFFLPQGELTIGPDGVTGADLTVDGSGNLTILSRAGLTLNRAGVSWTWPSADGTSGQFLQTNGAGALTFATTTGAPTGATYITQTAHADLTAEQALESLSTGIMRVATGTGVITSLTDSAGIAGNISDEEGSGALVFASSPTLTTPTIGVATATSIAIGANTLNTTEWANLDGQDQAVKTTDSPTFLDLTLTGSNPDLSLQHTGSDIFGLHTEAGSILYLKNETDGVYYLTVDATHKLNFGDINVPSYIFRASGTGDNTFQVPGQSISLQNEVTGTLPVASGGSGVTALSDILGTANQVTVTGGTARVIGGNVTLSAPQDIATSSTPTFGGLALTGDLDLDGSNINLTLQHTGGDEFGLHTEAGSILYLKNGTDGVTYWLANILHGIEYGSASVPSHVFRVSSSGDASVQLPLDSVGPGELLTTGAYAVGSLASTGAVTGSNLSGTNTGDVTLAGTPDYITISGQTITRGTVDIGDDTNLAGTANQVILTGDTLSTPQDIATTSTPTFGELTLSSASPVQVFTDSGGDDFEHDLTSSVYRITNTTDGITGYIHDASNTVGFGEVGHAPAKILLVTDGTGSGEVEMPAQSVGQAEIDFPNIEFTRSMYIENLVAADDDISMGSFDRPVTIKKIWVSFNGTGTTKATIALQDGAGNAMTHVTPVPVVQTSPAGQYPVTAANQLVAGEILAFDVTNTPDPTTDDYSVNISYVYDS